MGLPDTYDVLAQVDRWLATGDLGDLPSAIPEQGWPLAESLEKLAAAHAAWWGWTPHDGPPDRGVGWRVWLHAPGAADILDARDSTMMDWGDVPGGIVLGVAYAGAARRIVQSKDPYYLDAAGALRCHAAAGPCPDCPHGGTARWGTWVGDAVMADARWRAALAFAL